jgi:hypothetical protein
MYGKDIRIPNPATMREQALFLYTKSARLAQSEK